MTSKTTTKIDKIEDDKAISSTTSEDKVISSKIKNDFKRLCKEQACKASSNKSSVYTSILELIEDFTKNDVILQPTIKQVLQVSNPVVNNALRKLVKQEKLIVDKSSKPFKYYRNL